MRDVAPPMSSEVPHAEVLELIHVVGGQILRNTITGEAVHLSGSSWQLHFDGQGRGYIANVSQDHTASPKWVSDVLSKRAYRALASDSSIFVSDGDDVLWLSSLKKQFSRSYATLAIDRDIGRVFKALDISYRDVVSAFCDHPSSKRVRHMICPL